MFHSMFSDSDVSHLDTLGNNRLGKKGQDALRRISYFAVLTDSHTTERRI